MNNKPKQYAVTKKNGSCLITTDLNQAWKTAETNKTDLLQVQPERKIIACATWLDKTGNLQTEYKKGYKYNGLIERE